MANCVDLVTRLAQERGLNPSSDEMSALIREFEKEILKRPVMGPDRLNVAFDIAVNKTNEMRMAARQAKREALIKLVKRREINSKIDEYASGDIVKLAKTKTQSEKQLNGYSAQMLGTSQLVAGARDSAAARKAGLELNFTGSLLKSLHDAGEHLEDVLRKGSLDEEIYRYAYDRNADVSADAKAIHDVIFQHQNAQRERKNRAGAFIGEREDFLVRQTHSSQEIRKAGPEQWKSDILGLLDQEKTFKFFSSQQEIDGYLDDLYMRFASGRHNLVDDGQTGLIGTPQTFNMAKKISQARTLHFKDGSSAFEYAKKYSRDGIWDKLFEAARYDARTVTLLEMYGTNPKAMHNSIINDLLLRAQRNDENVSGLQLKKLEAEFQMLNGEMDIPANTTLAHIGFGMRALESMSKLGAAVVSAFSDPVFKGATLNRRTDMGFFGSYAKSFSGLLDRVPKSERKHVAELTNIYYEGALGKMFTRAGSIDGMPGKMAKAQETFFRWSLLQGWTLSHKEGIAHAIAFDLGRYRNTDFDSLPPNTKRNLQLYRITADEWSTVRSMETRFEDTNRHFVTPGGVRSLTDEVIDPIVSKQFGTTDINDGMRQSFRDTFATKLQTMFHDIADEGVVTPGERERLLLTGGTQKGTYFGEFLRFLSQFKSFPVTVISKQLLPQYYAAGGGVRGAAALVPIIVLTTTLGYISGAAKDVLRGREPKDPKSPAVWRDALLRGGGLGIFGDFMFAEYSRYGRSFEQTVAGPAIGTFSDALSLAHKSAMLKADAQDYFQFIKSITPGANLFYTEAAFNYLLFYGFMEQMEPGYLRRMEAQRRREYDQEFWLPPSDSAVQF